MTLRDAAHGALTVVVLLAAQPSAAVVSYRVDPDSSRTTIHVGKTGMFSFIAGHTHEVTAQIENGVIELDPGDPMRSHVRLAIAANSLMVSAEHEPKDDAPKVQEAMASEKVLDVAHYPQITYESTGVRIRDRRGSVLELLIVGQLTIRNTSRTINVPVHVETSDRELTARGRFAIKQSDFGIEPISIASVVAVKDTLEIEFSISARR
jgi:polyisoprenoid-binding protein YceI